MSLAILPLVTGSPATGSNLTTNQRSTRTVTDVERYAMYPGSIHIAQIHANERRQDFLVEAAHARLVNEAVQGRRSRDGASGPVSNLRHRIGVALVDVGHRLQHSSAPPATEPRAPLGTLGTVR